METKWIYVDPGMRREKAGKKEDAGDHFCNVRWLGCEAQWRTGRTTHKSRFGMILTWFPRCNNTTSPFLSPAARNPATSLGTNAIV